MKIIHAANFSLFPRKPLKSQQFALHYSIDRAISHGLVRLGHNVYDFAVEDSIRRYRRLWTRKKTAIALMNALLSEAVNRLRPDWLLLGHTPAVNTQTLALLRKCHPNLTIAQWWVDPLQPKHADRLSAIKEKLPHLDAFFCTTAPDYLSLPDISKMFFMPNLCDSAVHHGRAFALTEYRHDIVYVGRPDPERQTLVQQLQKHFSDRRLGIYGLERHQELCGADYVDTLASAKMAINFSRSNDTPLYSSDRMIHIIGNGALALSPKTPRMETLLDKDEVVYFDGLDDMCDKLHYYLAHDSERCTIAQKGWQRAHRDYNEKRVASFLQHVCFSEKKYNWHEWNAR